MSEQTWTIDSICEALGAPVLSQRFLKEINRAPAHELLPVFAKWRGIAEGVASAADRGRALAAEAAPSGDLAGDWVDMTDRVQAEATAARRRGAA